jgi:hypothetical protein
MAHEHGAGQHASPDDEYLSTPPDSTYEHTDANVWIIAKFLVWLLVSAIVIHVGLGFMYELLIDRALVEEQPYPLAQGQAQRLPPAPRLQQFPENEIYQFRMEEERLLQRYGWMNREAGIVHIPVDEAMRLTLERGAFQTVLQETTPSPGMMPADSSSGRTVERRRQ